ncbi:MAG: glycerophosphodiester phosphodiesterase [Flavobacteriaceae bacterium]|nr:glycerophosphodiester phosphodiesterase [Flavobacteriaceae bacterium]|tara:strand:- start:57 stop:815 length:759 start_codon:yes stop_codon:yes gene_type:complete
MKKIITFYTLIFFFIFISCVSNKKIMVIGHRGAAGHEVENTIPSIDKAISLGVDAVEVDVFLCKSGELVVFHDKNLSRLTNSNAFIESLTLDSINKIDVINNHKIPTLEEVIKFINKRVHLNIELKGLNTAKPTYELLQSLFLNKQDLIDKISISSFNWEELDIIYNLDNDISTAVLTETKAIERAINQAKKINAKAINIDYKLLNRKVVKMIKSEYLIINAWTVNEIHQIKRMINLGVDGIITDFPDRVIN